MHTDSHLPPLTPESREAGAHPAQPDPWGIVVVGSPSGVGPLCSEAGRLGFELFRSRALSSADIDRLRDGDWAVAVVVEDGSDMAVTKAMLQTCLAWTVPLVWVGPGAEPAADRTVGGDRTVVHLPMDCEPERIAAQAFERARKHLYPSDLPREIRKAFGRVLLDWQEDQLGWGPVWVKNHLTPPFCMTATLDLFGDVSGELTISASKVWFDRKVGAALHAAGDQVTTAGQAAAAIGEGLLDRMVTYFQSRGADLSTGVARIHEGSTPVLRRVSHRPALCLEFSTRDGELIVVEFSGTGLDTLDPPAPITTDFNPPISL